MGIFSRLKEKLGGAKAVEKPPEGFVTVPAGHVVQTFGVGNEPPALVRTPGNVFVASLGMGGDELPAEVDAVLDQLESAVGAGPPALLSAQTGGISGLFAPADAEVHRAIVIVWSFGVENLAPWFAHPDRLERQADRLRALGRGRQLPIVQSAFFLEDTPAARLVKTFWRDLGIQTRSPVRDNLMLAEVKRPEGLVISALLGAPDAASASQEAPKDLSRDAAESLCRAAAGLFPGPDQPVGHSTRLRRILLEEMDGKPSRLDEELSTRIRPLLLLGHPATGNLMPQQWGEITALAAYADFQSVQRAAEDLDIRQPKIVGMSPAGLLRTAAANGFGLAFNVYRARTAPFYLLRDATAIARLAAKL